MALTRPRAYQIYDIDYKQAVRVITVSNISLTLGAPNSVDGVNLSVNDRILVAGQSNPAQNGLYYVTTLGTGSNGTWSRSIDANSTGELLSGTIVMVTEGATYADTSWKLVTDDPITIGSTSLVFEQNTGDAFGTVNANGTSITANTASATLNLAAGDNISIVGNNTSKTATISVTGISLNSISNGTSNVTVVSSGGNVTVGIAGAEVAEFSTSGLDITGTVTASGNITGSNVNTAGLVSATGNITGGNLVTSGKVDATGNITSSANVSGSYLLGNIFYASGYSASKIYNGTTEANIGTTNGNANISVGGTSNVVVFAPTGEYVSGLITATGNVSGGNLTTVGQVTATGNITGGNISTAGQLKTTGTFLIGTQEFYAQGSDGFSVNENFNAGNATVTAYHYTSGAGRNAIVFDTAVTGQFTTGFGTTGTAASNKFVFFAEFGNTFWEWRKSVGIQAPNLNGGTLLANLNANGNFWTAGTITGTGNITGGNVAGTLLTGTITTAAQPNITSVGTLSSLSVSGNITGGNISTAGQVSATGNITGGNLTTLGAVNTGTLTTTGNTIIGGNLVVNGNTIYTNITDLTVQDPIISLGRGANNAPLTTNDGKDRGEQLWYYDTAEKSAFIGYDNSTGKLIAASNVSISNEIVTVTDYGSFVVGGLEATTATATGNVTGGNLVTAGQVSATGNVAGGNLTTAGQVSATENITGGNLVTAGQVSATGNITSSGNVSGSYILGNVFYASGITASKIYNGVSEVNIASANANANISINGTSNVVVVSSAGVYTSGLLTVTGNITGGNLVTAGQITATGNITGGNVIGIGSSLTGIDAFGTITVSGQSDVVADSTSDTLTLVAGTGIAITTDAGNDSITISSAATDSIFATGGDMGTTSEAVTSSEDLGSITEAVNVQYDLGTETTAGIVTPSLLLLPSYTVAELGSVSASPPGQFVYCTNESGGAIPAFSDGTNWRRVTDRAIVS